MQRNIIGLSYYNLNNFQLATINEDECVALHRSTAVKGITVV